MTTKLLNVCDMCKQDPPKFSARIRVENITISGHLENTSTMDLCLDCQKAFWENWHRMVEERRTR